MLSIKEEYATLENVAPKSPIFNEEKRQSIFKSALSPHSFSKNRYPDILAVENSRVHLEKIEGLEGSDYINANYVINDQYISCQAPIFSTFSDFWRMVWENQCPVVLMLTKFFENGRTKAHMYWPAFNNSPMNFGDISVTKIDEEEDLCGSLVVRTILLNRKGVLRTVYQLHYTAWPDFGVPSSTEGIRELVNLVNMYTDLSSTPNGPLVVHCSAGVGRSGTFIAIHYAFSMLDNDIEPSVFQIVAQMRRDRIGTIQNEQQFEFIHMSIQDYKSFLSSAISLSLNSSSMSSDESDIDFESSDSANSSYPTSPSSYDWRKVSSAGINALRSSQSPLNVLS